MKFAFFFFFFKSESVANVHAGSGASDAADDSRVS